MTKQSLEFAKTKKTEHIYPQIIGTKQTPLTCSTKVATTDNPKIFEDVAKDSQVTKGKRHPSTSWSPVTSKMETRTSGTMNKGERLKGRGSSFKYGSDICRTTWKRCSGRSPNWSNDDTVLTSNQSIDKKDDEYVDIDKWMKRDFLIMVASSITSSKSNWNHGLLPLPGQW